MQKAHHRRLAFRRTAFHDRAYENLVQPAADRAERHADDQPDVRVRHQVGQEAERRQPYAREDMRRYDGGPVSYFVDKLRGGEIDKELQHEIQRNEQRDLFQRNPVSRLKCQKQQRREVVYDSLRNVADTARAERMFIICFYPHVSSRVKKSFTSSILRAAAFCVPLKLYTKRGGIATIYNLKQRRRRKSRRLRFIG